MPAGTPKHLHDAHECTHYLLTRALSGTTKCLNSGPKSLRGVSISSAGGGGGGAIVCWLSKEGGGGGGGGEDVSS